MDVGLKPGKLWKEDETHELLTYYRKYSTVSMYVCQLLIQLLVCNSTKVLQSCHKRQDTDWNAFERVEHNLYTTIEDYGQGPNKGGMTATSIT